ncbi:MAG: ribonuclease Z [Clostridia bacterium]|nr:ribonuclease Z [Clostridia bacterium]
MKLIVCLDDNLGMMFNHRRQSRDRVLIAELLETVGDRRLFISPYSAPLFPAGANHITVAEDPCAVAGKEDYAFVENTDPTSGWARVDTVILYRWNRLYPADRQFHGDMTGFCLTETTEFVGSSHDRITKEVWKK